jgi:hypothetical protein
LRPFEALAVRSFIVDGELIAHDTRRQYTRGDDHAALLPKTCVIWAPLRSPVEQFGRIVA